MEKVILLADKESHSWELAEKIQEYLKREKEIEIPLKEVSIKYFRNKEIDMHVPENVRKKDVFFVHDSSKNPQQWWVELLLLKDLLLSASAESVSFVLPNMLYSRKDRKDRPHVPISARALAKSISPGVARIITIDLHASQIQGFYPEEIPLDNLYSFPEVVRYLQKTGEIQNLDDTVILSPDAGGVDRARAFAQKIDSKNPIAFIEKRRHSPGEVAEMRLSGNVVNKNVLIVDDIIDSGGTLCKAAKLLKEKGAKNLYCYGTHGIFTRGIQELCQNFDKVFTSNTHAQSQNQDINSKFKVIDVSSMFAEAIYRAQQGLSISRLFE